MDSFLLIITHFNASKYRRIQIICSLNVKDEKDHGPQTISGVNGLFVIVLFHWQHHHFPFVYTADIFYPWLLLWYQKNNSNIV